VSNGRNPVQLNLPSSAIFSAKTADLGEDDGSRHVPSIYLTPHGYLLHCVVTNSENFPRGSIFIVHRRHRHSSRIIPNKTIGKASFMHLPRGFGLVSALALLVSASVSAIATINTTMATISIASAPRPQSGTWS